MERIHKTTTAAHFIASPCVHPTTGQVSLQGNGKSEMFTADVKSYSWTIVNDRSRGWRDWFRGGKRSGVMLRGRRKRLAVSRRRSRLGVSRRRSRLSGGARSLDGVDVIARSGCGLMNCRGFLSGTTVVARTLRHCLVAKSADQANHNDCCKKLFHDVCLLYW